MVILLVRRTFSSCQIAAQPSFKIAPLKSIFLDEICCQKFAFFQAKGFGRVPDVPVLLRHRVDGLVLFQHLKTDRCDIRRIKRSILQDFFFSVESNLF